MTTKTLDFNDIERKIFWTLTALLSVALAFYLYSALSLTIAGVDRDYLSRSAHALATKVGDLEAQYLTQSNTITLSHAEELGFHEVNAKFAGVTTVSAKLSMAR